MSAIPQNQSMSRYGYDPQSVFVDFFKAQDTAVKAAIVFGAVVVGYSLLTSTFTAALAGGFVGARLGIYSLRPQYIPVPQQPILEKA